MKIELHALQNFVPANLNRDDTGTPKNCYFGGYRRARISSQSFKRAMRDAFRTGGVLPSTTLGSRTLRVVEVIATRLADPKAPDAIPLEEGRELVTRALSALKLAVKPDGRTDYLLFLSPEQLDALTAQCRALRSTVTPTDDAAKPAARGRRQADSGVSAEIGSAIRDAMKRGHAADIALFGRMIADLPEINVNAAAQVAHAVSTNKVDIEFDYFTAVDDLQPGAETGAGMIGTVEFNSACFYRYASVDVDQLARNLAGDEQPVTASVADLTRRTVEAFVRAFVTAIPTGKQNSMAAHNPPSFILAVARDGGNWSLANAFVQPVAPKPNADLVSGSIAALDAYWGDLTAMYGRQGISGQWYAAVGTPAVATLKESRVVSLDALVSHVLDATQVVAV